MAKDPNAPATNKDLDEAVTAILEGMDKITKDFREEVSVAFKNVDGRFNLVDKRFDNVDAEITWVKNDIEGLTADLSDTTSKKEFNQFKTKVDKYLVD